MLQKRAGEKSDIQARHDKRKLKRIRGQKIRRYSFFTFLAAIALLAVMFFTPFFNVKNIQISGNARISTEQISDNLKDLHGKNLFRISNRSVRKKLFTLPYVEKVTIKKKPFPPTLSVSVKECNPIGQVDYNGSLVTIDASFKILEVSDERFYGIPTILGTSPSSAKEGDTIHFRDAEEEDIIVSCISHIEKSGLVSNITQISFEDITNITFKYQDRLDAICGTHIDFQRKLALFKEAVNSNRLTENSRGTINLSTTGKAIYTP